MTGYDAYTDVTLLDDLDVVAIKDDGIYVTDGEYVWSLVDDDYINNTGLQPYYPHE